MKEDTKNILFHTAVLFVLTLPFLFFNIDLKIQSLLYDFPMKFWKYAGTMPVKILYEFGVYPALIMTAIAVVIFGLGFAVKKMEKHRKTALLIILTLFIGPAVTINGILKNYVGRPRPLAIKEFNGEKDFKNMFQRGKTATGSSFPCGHASMGFLFMALYFVYKRKNKPAAYAAFFGGLIYGSAIGAARMAQGAHFMSDVLWAGGITFISAEIVWYKILGGDEEFLFNFMNAGRKGKVLSAAVIMSLLAVLVLVFLFSVPFETKRNFMIAPVTGTLELVLNVEGDLSIVQKENSDFIQLRASGFGFPNRRFNGKIEKSITQNGVKYVFSTVKKGFFSELNSVVRVYLPQAEKYLITIHNAAGDITCELNGAAPLVVLATKSGDIEFKAGSVIKELYIKTGSGDAGVIFDTGTKFLASAFVDVNVHDTFRISNRSAFFKELNLQGQKITGSRELYFKSTKKDGPSMSVKAGKIIIR